MAESGGEQAKSKPPANGPSLREDLGNIFRYYVLGQRPTKKDPRQGIKAKVDTVVALEAARRKLAALDKQRSNGEIK